MGRKKYTEDEIEEYRKKINRRVFYFNKEDSNILVPKAYGYGFTVNWANPITWVLILVVIAFIVWKMFIA